MSRSEWIAVAAGVWAGLFIVKALVCIPACRWTLVGLSANLSFFFMRYGVNVWHTAGHDTDGFGWVNNHTLILVQIIVGCVLTAGFIMELVIQHWPYEWSP